MEKNNNDLCILSEVAIPGVAEGNVNDSSMQIICRKCGELKKDCKCKE